MQYWRDDLIRYLIYFDDGGSGMRQRNEPLELLCADCHIEALETVGRLTWRRASDHGAYGRQESPERGMPTRTCRPSVAAECSAAAVGAMGTDGT
jgi:hypothetical protein